MRLPTRLTLYIYSVSLIQLLVVAGTIALVGFLTFKPHGPAELRAEGRYALETVAAVSDDPARLLGESARVLRTLQGKLSLYAADGSLLVSNVQPALTLTDAELAQLRTGQPVLRHGPPPLLAIPLHGSRAAHGVFVSGRRRPPPPRIVWVLLIALLGAAGAAVVLARSFARPLHALTETARAFGAGDLSARAHVERRDEFGQLSDAFNEMAQRVSQLVRAQQQLLADVSHELRTPLSRIRVALDLAAEGDAAMARSALEEISSDLGELTRLLDDVLQMARLELLAGRAEHGVPPLRDEVIELPALLQRSSERFRALHPQHVLESRLEGPVGALRGDAALLRRALDNLLDNAAAYSDVSQPVVLSLRCEPSQLTLQVRDRGMGIEAEHLPQIGTPFYRTDRSRARRTGGLGLGVSLSRRIVAAHGGTLTLASEPGVGTTASIHLPTRRGARDDEDVLKKT